MFAYDLFDNYSLFVCLLFLQETDQEKVVEAKTPRRGRSSKPTEEADREQDESPSGDRGHSGAAAKEAAAGRTVTLNDPTI